MAVLEGSRAEERWQTLGMVCSCLLLLLVAHTTIETDVEGDTVEIVRIISARKADAKEREDMKRKIQPKIWRIAYSPPLTEEQKAQIASLSALPDEQIDYADAPATGEKSGGTAVQGRFINR